MKVASITFEFPSKYESECVTKFNNGWILSTIGSSYSHERLVNAAFTATYGGSDIQSLIFFDKCNVVFLSADQLNDQAACCDTCNKQNFDIGLLRKTQCQDCWEASCEKAFQEEIDKGDHGVFGGIH
jgi:hypothetical protein